MDIGAAAKRAKKKASDTVGEYVQAAKDIASIPGKLSAPGGLEIHSEQGRLGKQKFQGAGTYARKKKS